MATGYLKGLLGEDEYESARQSAVSNSLLMAGLQGLMASGPSLTPTSIGQVLGQAGMAGLGAYGSSMEQSERQGLRGQEMRAEQEQKARREQFNQALQGVYTTSGQINYPALQSLITQFPDMASEAVNAVKSGVRPVVAPPKPESFTLKPGETRYVVGPDGQPQLVASSPKESGTAISPLVDRFMEFKFGTSNFSQLTREQQAEALAFANAPDDEKLTTLNIAAQEAAFGMPGANIQVPFGRSSFLDRVGQSEQQPKPQETTTYMGMNSERLSTPLKENEVPLIQSQGISGKNREVLLLNQPQETNSLEYTVDNIRQMRNSAFAVLNHPNMKSAFGFGGESFSKIPGSQAANVRALLDPLKNQSFVSGLQAMRQASPTGGAVGNVSNAEGARFENLIRSLDQAQSPKQVEESLNKIIQFMDEAEQRVQNAYKRTYGTVPQLTVRSIDSSTTGGLPPGVTVKKR